MSKNQSIDLKAISDLYSQSLKTYGSEAQGVGWGDIQSHLLRFEKLLVLLEGHRNKSLTINDLGCGYGALYEVLKEMGYDLAHYRGYEISDDMMREAESRIGSGKTQLIQGGTLTDPADYSFASGIFNVRLEHSDEEWTGHIHDILDNLNQFSEHGFAFNLLTTYVDYKESHLYYGDPGHFLDWCIRRYSRHVTLLHDYPLYEWTIIVRK